MCVVGLNCLSVWLFDIDFYSFLHCKKSNGNGKFYKDFLTIYKKKGFFLRNFLLLLQVSQNFQQKIFS